ncbi:MAG TPA: hypothetical protein VFQ13_24450 [Anaerolineales bacterium]|nr:hypothetical protein [Anaerolineales bacterium]
MKPVKSHVLRITITLLVFVSIACGGSIVSLPSADATSTAIAGTLQAVTPFASPTRTTSAPLPSPTLSVSTSTSAPSPSAPSISNATRISFVPGTTYSLTQGSIPAGQTLTYFLRALEGQPMIVTLDTPDQSTTLSVFGANGIVLLPQSDQATSWQGTLPETQDYYFRITGGGSAQSFTLNVNIPARIEFSSGQSQTTLRGQTVGGYAVMYVAYAFGGQQMEVTINTAPEVAALTIWGFSDGQPYARAQNGVTDFSMTLPSTQDYIIQVVPQGGNVVDYEVTVRIQ